LWPDHLCRDHPGGLPLPCSAGTPPFHVRAPARSGSPTSVRRRSPRHRGNAWDLRMFHRSGQGSSRQAHEPHDYGYGRRHEQERGHRPSPPFSRLLVSGALNGAPCVPPRHDGTAAALAGDAGATSEWSPFASSAMAQGPSPVHMPDTGIIRRLRQPRRIQRQHRPGSEADPAPAAPPP
jgi:hypothetical protein